MVTNIQHSEPCDLQVKVIFGDLIITYNTSLCSWGTIIYLPRKQSEYLKYNLLYENYTSMSLIRKTEE